MSTEPVPFPASSRFKLVPPPIASIVGLLPEAAFPTEMLLIAELAFVNVISSLADESRSNPSFPELITGPSRVLPLSVCVAALSVTIHSHLVIEFVYLHSVLQLLISFHCRLL